MFIVGLIKGYGDVLLEEYGPTAKRKDEDRPAYVQFYETLRKLSTSASLTSAAAILYSVR